MRAPVSAHPTAPAATKPARTSWVVRLVVLAGMLLAGVTEGAAAEATKEYQVKAAFLLRFIQFVEWPEGSFPAEDVPIRIGILGEDPFGSTLDRVIGGERIRHHSLTVERATSVMELRNCQVIFVAASERDRLREVVAQLPMEGVLTVSDLEGFAEQGGMIRLFLADKKVRFELNPSVAHKRQLKLSAQLLSLGKIVGPAIVDGAP